MARMITCGAQESGIEKGASARHEAKWSDAVPDITTSDKMVSAFNVFAEITKVYSMNPVEEILRNLSSALPHHELLSALRTKGEELIKQHRKCYVHCTQVELLVLWIWSLEGVQIDRFCGWQDAPSKVIYGMKWSRMGTWSRME